MKGGEGFGMVFNRADLQNRPHNESMKRSWMNRVSVETRSTSDLARMLVNKMEDGFLLWVPVDALVQSLSFKFAGHNLQEVQLYRLLNEDHVIGRHG